MSFVQRKIRVQVTLSPGPEGQPKTFTESGTDTVTLDNLRMSCKISKAGGLSDSTMNLTIFGMTFSLMNQISTLGMQINLVPKDRIVVTAGDDVSGLGTVFDGYILAAYVNLENLPEVSFIISAQTNPVFAVIPAVASSFPTSVDVATVMSGFATLMGLKFENNGVTTKLPVSYFSGSVKSQAQAAVTAAGIEWVVDNGVLAIWPKNGSRGGAIPLLSSRTGLVGYPVYSAYGIVAKSLFNPSIGFGGKFKVESDLPAANGTWIVYSLDYSLASQFPNGDWFMTVGGYNPAHPVPVVGAR